MTRRQNRLKRRETRPKVLFDEGSQSQNQCKYNGQSEEREIKVKPIKLPRARENKSDQVVIDFSLHVIG